MLIKLFCELVFAHDWTAWASDGFGVWSRANAEKKRLAEIARHDDECGLLWELACAVFEGAEPSTEEADNNLFEFLEAWDLWPNWRHEVKRCREPRHDWRYCPVESARQALPNLPDEIPF